MTGKHLVIILICAAAAAIPASAKDAGKEKSDAKAWPVMTYGAEWSYAATLCSSYHQNFYSSEGSMVDIRKTRFGLKSNGEMNLHVGANLGKMWNLSLYAGYTGVGKYHHAIPVSFRLTRFYGQNPMQDRWLSFMELGSGVALHKKHSVMLGAKLGGGYRVSLGRLAKLDIIASFRLSYSNPDRIIHYDQDIPAESINRNNAFSTAFTIGLGITL